MSPGDGSGSSEKPRSGSIGSTTCFSSPVRRRSSWSAACSRSFASVSGRIFGTVVSGGMLPRASRVGDPGGGEPLDLRSGDRGDEREVVVVAPLLLAALEEDAERAVVDRVRVGRVAVLDRGEEPLLEPVVVGEEVVGPECLPLAEPVDDMHCVWAVALDACELLGVEAELEHVRRLRPSRELRVDDLVRPVRLALEEVGEPAPAPVGVAEDRLVDDVGLARPDGVLGARGGPLPVLLAHVGDLEAAVVELLEVASLVLVTLPPNEIPVRIVSERLRNLAAHDGELERRQVRAGEEPDQVGRREDELGVTLLHPLDCRLQLLVDLRARDLREFGAHIGFQVDGYDRLREGRV